MIEELRIENLGVIAQATLGLTSGLTALTGETGAGKTMAVTSLELLLGGKADATKVRSGSDMARVEGTFIVSDDSPILSSIDEVGGRYDLERGQAVILVARQIPANGRSAAFIGGRRVPTSVLRNIAQHLVTVHGQSDQIRLATNAQQRRALDSFGGARVSAAAEAWREAHKAHARALGAFQDFEEEAKGHARQRLALQALLGKVDEVRPAIGEDEALRAEARALENVESRFLALSEAAGKLSGSDTVDASAVDAISEALHFLETLGGEEVDEVIARLERAQTDVNDIAATLAGLAGQAEAKPERLAEIYARRQVLAKLRRELGMGVDEAVQAGEEARQALDRLGDPEGSRQRLRLELERAEKNMDSAGEALHRARVAAARELSRLVRAELAELALPDARFEISIEKAAPTSHGSDSISFLLASHKGAPLQPIGVSASGGELSRVMLAIEVSLAERSGEADHTFLFDEIDAGVGGRAALAVGKRLAHLASNQQVIVVTHLAQVAAFAGTQAVVVKDEGRKGVRTDVAVVDGDERLAELARMLSGNDSQTARAHASELLSLGSMAR